MNISFQKDYSTFLTQDMDNTSSGEIEIFLNDTPESDIGFLLIEKGISGQEESLFYHRKVGNSVFCYGVNRGNIVTHLENSNVLLVNAIDAMNYLSKNGFQQFNIYKKSTTDIIIKGGKIFENGFMVNIPDVDTSNGYEDQTLIVNSTNYIYLDSGITKITNIYNEKLYIISEVIVDVSGNITDINTDRPLVFNLITLSDISEISAVVDSAITAQKGEANGLAPLDAGGLIDTTYLPSYVDDVLEYDTVALLPAEGISGKIYIITTGLDANKSYRWGGSVYVEITDDTAVWGKIGGNILDQTDLQAVLTTINNLITLRELLSNKSTSTALGTSDIFYPSQKAVKAYVDSKLGQATTTALGLVETATYEEVQAGVDTNRYINPLDLMSMLSIQASDAVITNLADFSNAVDSTSVKGREITIKIPGTYRIKFHILGDTGDGTCSGVVKKNGTTVFTGAYNDSTNGISYATDQTFAIGDSLEIWGTHSGDNASLSEISICGTSTAFVNVL